MSYELLSIDTEPHPEFPVYSAGNFGEVAPERLSIMAWSLVGEPVERACRALVRRMWPRATWQSGSHYVFVGYFGCRPYHNLSGYCHLACQIPGLSAEDVTSSYFEDAPDPPRPDDRRADSIARSAALGRMMIEGASLRGRVAETEGRVIELEDAARAAMGAGRAVALGLVFERARKLLGEVWNLHYTTTLILVPLRAAQRAVGRRAVPYWEELEPWLNTPSELVWSTLHDGRRDRLALGPAEFLSRAFYEVADEQEPWRGYADRQWAGRTTPRSSAKGGGIASSAWKMLPRARLALLPQLGHVVSETMASREASKSLAMRCLHVFRTIIPPIAADAGVDGSEWPYLTIGELADGTPLAELRERVERRREDCERGLAIPMGELIAPGRPDLDLATERPPSRNGGAVGRGVSPGVARGRVVFPSRLELDTEGTRILVCESADADVQPILPQVHGLISARGSVLSHVSILAREYGIPAVVGHPLAPGLNVGQQVSIDGTTGEVQVIDV